MLNHSESGTKSSLEKAHGLLGLAIEIHGFISWIDCFRPFLPVGMNAARHKAIGGTLVAGPQEGWGVFNKGISQDTVEVLDVNCLTNFDSKGAAQIVNKPLGLSPRSIPNGAIRHNRGDPALWNSIKVMDILVDPLCGFKVVHREGSLKHADRAFGLGSDVEEKKGSRLICFAQCASPIVVVIVVTVAVLAVIKLVLILVDLSP